MFGVPLSVVARPLMLLPRPVGLARESNYDSPRHRICQGCQSYTHSFRGFDMEELPEKISLSLNVFNYRRVGITQHFIQRYTLHYKL